MIDVTREVPRVFLSHSWLDKPLARRVARRLRHAGAEVFIDEERLQAGAVLTQSIRHAITGSTHLVVIWTAAAAASAWVRRELEFASSAPHPAPAIIPLLVIPPGTDPIVANVLGVDFQQVHRFERSFEHLAKAIFQRDWKAASPEQLAADLANTFRETPAIGRLLRNPVNEHYSTLSEAHDPADLTSDPDLRGKTLAALGKVFKGWQAEGISLLGLPAAAEADYHALDFALWCAVHIMMARRAELAPLLPVELKKYPEIFAKVLGRTQAGFEALVVILTTYPGLASDAMSQLTYSDNVSEAAMPTVVELFEMIFALARDDSAKDQFTPYGAAIYFLRRNADRLSLQQKQVFFRLVEAHEQGPYPGGPFDILDELRSDARLRPEVMQRMQFWVEHGLFDRVDAQSRSESPRLLYALVADLYKDGLKDDARKLLNSAYGRIRKLFRMAEPESMVLALHWVADSEHLPRSERALIIQAYEEGVFSSELESSEHADTVKQLAALLVDSLRSRNSVESSLRHDVRTQLKEAGLPGDLF